MKIKTIDITAYEWFDKINGNSYFAGEVVINFGLSDSRAFKMPFQYGYGDHYREMAKERLIKEGLLPKKYKTSAFWNVSDKMGIVIRYTKHENCLKRDLIKRFGG